MSRPRIIIAGSGNAALCAGISALEHGADVLIVEKASPGEAGGNSRYTAGAMRFSYDSSADILALLADRSDRRLRRSEFGAYPAQQFAADLASFNDGEEPGFLQKCLVSESYNTLCWLKSHNVRFEPIYDRQAFVKNGRYVFWGGLTLQSQNEGVGLVDAELRQFRALGGEIQYESECIELLNGRSGIEGVICATPDGRSTLPADAVVLGCGGFEANADLRARFMGEIWRHARVRGTRHNSGSGLEMALASGAALAGRPDACHAVPMDYYMPEYGNTELPFIERKRYRKISYFLGVMLNARGERFVDEGQNFRNYTYAQFGRAVLEQPGRIAWQVFDSKVDALLYDDYRGSHANFVTATSLPELIENMEGVDRAAATDTLQSFNDAIDDSVAFDPATLDGRRTHGLKINKSNWANRLDTPPFKAYPVTCGITFTYAGLKIDQSAAVIDNLGNPIDGLFACGEIVGGVFNAGYPGGSGLTSGAVFGRIAGRSAATGKEGSGNHSGR